MNLESWYRDLIERRSAKLPRTVRVEGIREKHMGPRCEYGRIVVEAQPADQFAVSGPTGPLSIDEEDYVRAALFGILDVLLTAEPFPLRDINLVVVEIHPHPVDSSVMAFRKAGRDAGTKLLREAGLREN
jgi:hypothetical protein